MDVKSTTQPESFPKNKRIRAFRRQLELSQLDVALNVGISQSQYSLFEQGYVRLPSEKVQAIDELLNTACRRESDHGK